MSTQSFTYLDLQAATSGKWYNLTPACHGIAKRNQERSTLNAEQKNSPYKINGVTSISTDTRTNNKDALFLALIGLNFDAHNYLKEAVDSGAAALCLQKGKYETDKMPPNIPILEVQNTLKAYQDIANFHRKRLKELTLIAITGSNGKTSTKDILHGILSSEFGEKKVYTTKANTNNLIGVPQNILNLTDKHRFAVIELGSNHPGEISQLTQIANPDIAVITSIGPAHLEYFKNINGVIKEKTSIFSAFNNPKKGIAIIPEECKGAARPSKPWRSLVSALNIPTITFGKTGRANIGWKHLHTTIDKCEFELHWQTTGIAEKITWSVPGIHQLSNATAAAAVATAIGITPKNIATALHSCKISGMRMKISKTDGITWINDAYNANPSSTKAGIDWLHEIVKNMLPIDNNKRLFVILGDMLELGKNALKTHKEIIKYTVNKLPCSQILGVGPIMHNVINELNRNSEHSTLNVKLKSSLCSTQNIHAHNDDENIPNLPIGAFKNSKEATSFLKNKLKTGDLIYLKGSRGIALEKIEQIF